MIETKPEQTVVVKPSIAEQVVKTQLNTKIRFNIIDHLGFDNASLAMY